MKNKNMVMITDSAEIEKHKKSLALYTKVSPQEMAKIERNMALVGITNKSAFVRRMCLDGGIYKVDLPEIQEVSRLMSITANNVNQLARKANGGGHVPREAVEHIDEILTECRELFGSVMMKLAKY